MFHLSLRTYSVVLEVGKLCKFSVELNGVHSKLFCYFNELNSN